MFGMLERKLRKDGRSAMATVLKSEYGGGSAASNPSAKRHCTLEIRVEPDGEPTFDAKVSGWLVDVPKAGHVVAVLYDPADHDRIAIDGSDEAIMAAHRERYRRMGQRPGSQQIVLTASGPTAGNPLAALFGGAGGQAAAPAPESTVDQLTKLADLRDRGVLTGAEFEAQKKTLLGE